MDDVADNIWPAVPQREKFFEAARGAQAVRVHQVFVLDVAAQVEFESKV